MRPGGSVCQLNIGPDDESLKLDAVICDGIELFSDRILDASTAAAGNDAAIEQTGDQSRDKRNEDEFGIA
jgi:hypothetical protein